MHSPALMELNTFSFHNSTLSHFCSAFCVTAFWHLFPLLFFFGNLLFISSFQSVYGLHLDFFLFLYFFLCFHSNASVLFSCWLFKSFFFTQSSIPNVARLLNYSIFISQAHLKLPFAFPFLFISTLCRLWFDCNCCFNSFPFEL